MSFRFLTLLLSLAGPALAQHEHHQMAPPKLAPVKPTPSGPAPVPATTRPAGSAPAPVDTARLRMPAGAGMDQHIGHDMGGMVPDSTMPGMDHGSMSHAYSRHLPMSRNGSGTSWQPDATPMYMWMQHKGPWMLMYHGQAFGRYTRQNFNHKNGRGHDSQVDGPNWAMVMAQRNVGGRGLLNLTLMMSLDPFTETRGGYPLLFQTGESYQGQALVDKQHPHDLFSGLSVGYTHALSDDVDLTAYLGYPGEPAIGPVAFMHRLSAMPNPDAPLSHHWTDATHITFGVATLGLRYRQFKLEGSNFTGREPDEHRFDFDRPRADSWAGRLSWNPSRNISWQFSHAFLKNPEEQHYGDVRRTTLSLQHSHSWGERHYVASTFVWGVNESHEKNQLALLAETNLTLGRPTFYGRYELVQKDGEELRIRYVDSVSSNGLINGNTFSINALTLGASYRLSGDAAKGPELHVGGQITGYLIDSQLQNLPYSGGPGYGSFPLSASVYLRLNAPWMASMSGGSMRGMKM